jgi:hypothetical protein
MSARVPLWSMAGSTRISLPKTNSYDLGAALGALFRCDGALLH